eukprot:g51712.t1
MTETNNELTGKSRTKKMGVSTREGFYPLMEIGNAAWTRSCSVLNSMIQFMDLRLCLLVLTVIKFLSSCYRVQTDRTIDGTGKDVVCDGIGGESDEKRFCYLNLTIPLQVLPDISNLPKPHIVFQSTQFCGGEDWIGKRHADEELERELWDPRVVVSFQHKAWVDTETNIYGLKHSAKPVHDALLARGVKRCIQFEDNLSSHITAEAETC